MANKILNMDFLTEAEKEEIKKELPQNRLTEFLISRLESPLEYKPVKYYFKYAYKDKPSRVIIVFGNWPERNLKTIALKHEAPFLIRTMTREEAIDELMRLRFSSCRYEDWQTLIDDEKRLGTPAEFIEQLESYRSKFKLGDSIQKQPVQTC